jgi:two-component system sensor histidine kinase HydH
MSIRATLLIAFLLFSMVAAAVMTALAYAKSRAALSSEIEENLEAQAVTVMQQIEAGIFERVENIYGWSQLDLMQEVRVDDVDKRLSRFLNDIESGYAGIYINLVCVRQGRIISAANASLIGGTWPSKPVWLSVQMPSSKVVLERPELSESKPVLTFGAPLKDAFSGEPLGEIYAEYDWADVLALLDYTIGASQRRAVLLDQDGRLLAASAKLDDARAITLPGITNVAAGGPRSGVISDNGGVFGPSPVLVGYARATGYKGLPELGWQLLIITPEKLAFGSVTRLLQTLLLLLILIAIIAIVLATRISAHIARPIQNLTSITRKIDPDLQQLPERIAGTGEVAELSAAFQRMVEDLRQSRQDLIRVSKLAAAGEMAAMLAHEVRNPLGILRSSAQLLKRQKGLDARGLEMLDFMIQEADRINELVLGLLEQARPREPVMSEHNVNDIVRQILERIRSRAEQKHIALNFLPHDEPINVLCDREQLGQVMLNLVLNAIQILAENAIVQIETCFTEDDVFIEVADDGPGVPEPMRRQILEPFISQREGGIGLGLTIVQDILRRHGGELTLGTAMLGGASFRVRLPRRGPGEQAE